jgi:malto-oligosyltrehalose trehalohydrolase/4-alpha-glucanotransferase
MAVRGLPIQGRRPKPRHSRPEITSGVFGEAERLSGGGLFALNPHHRSSTVPLPSARSADPRRDPAYRRWPRALIKCVQAALPDFLQRQRWYPGKGVGRPAVKLSALLPVPTSPVTAAVAVWQVTPPGQSPMHLFIPLALVPEREADLAQVIAQQLPDTKHDGEMRLVEAFSVDEFVWAWVDILLRGGGEASGEIRLRTARTDRLARAGLDAGSGWAIRRDSAEQSNTSIRVGDRAILKVIRKLESGAHPELEVSRFLTETNSFAASPSLLGWAELDGAASTPGAMTLSILQSFVPNAGDGWSWVIQWLARAINPKEGRTEGLVEVIALLRQLGRRTAEMHRAFETDTDDPEFRPEPVELNDIQSWAAAAQATAHRALDAIADGANLAPPDRTLAETLLTRREELVERLRTSLSGAPIFVKTRHHGDYHLGQVLVTNSGRDAVIIDFEGEPLRPLAERRAKTAPLRDVAGMLRSFAYATATASRSLPEHLPQAERDSVERRLAAWEQEATDVFLEAYFETARGGGFCQEDRLKADKVIQFFMLEKALYEIAYELANRPDWVAIPLRGVLALLDNDGAAPVRRMHRMSFGAELQADGTSRFRLWAPSHRKMQVELDGGIVAMERRDDGWHELVTDRAGAGTRYRFVLPDGLRVPDPASRYQPEDVHGPSEVIDPTAYEWRDAGWNGRAWEEAVVYELHIGAFTTEGTFRAAIGKLDHLVSLGVTAIEIMPIADFPGRRNWGYDGVLPYAPDSSYGRPEELKALVEAAHAHGLIVLLDVVYNHFGPEGAYIHSIAPEAFTDRHETPWGDAINFDGPHSGPVREFVIHNALYWIEEFHLDGLRLDAVHAILDDSPKHLLDELAERVREAAPSRHIHLVLENEENQAERLVRGGNGAPRWYTAQWNDDVHHVLHVAASGETKGYYADYNGDTEKLGRALAEGFAFQGELMRYRGRPRGAPSTNLPPTAFVAFIQNHDQVGNRAFGDRITDFATAEAVRAISAVYLLLPEIPMLFMGEEWGAAQPFPFFCDFGPELADGVGQGRREEFARFPEFQDPATRERIPDPLSDETFASAKLDWADIERAPHAGWLDLHRRLLAVRRAEIVPRLAAIRSGGQYEVFGDGAVVVRWQSELGDTLVLAANLAAKPATGFPGETGRLLWQEGQVSGDGTFDAWTVRWSVEKTVRDEAGRSALDELAERMGIEPQFRNARGEIVLTSGATKRSLLAAMGIEAADEMQARGALAPLDRAEWLRPLPVTQVLRSDAQAPIVELTLPADTVEITWRLTLENGAEQSGCAPFSELELVEARSFEGTALERRRLLLGGELPWGYHRFAIEPDGTSMTLIVTPGQCWLPPALTEGRRLWGIAAQLYLLRSDRDWGIGDFRDLRRLVELAADRGADVIGLNPLHAMFPDDPEHASPYSPASRVLLNILNIDVTAVPELLGCPEMGDLITSEAFGQNVAACRAKHLVDYAEVTAIKLSVLEKLFDACRGAVDPVRWRAFEAFRREQGEMLERNCVFLVLREHFGNQDASHSDWHAWPKEYRDPASPAVARFAAENRHRVDFFAWLQWVADEQLAAAAATAKDRGMAVGLYRDFAVGADRAGAEAWANAAAVISGAQVGAPPDIHNPAGQNWGLPPLNPRALREEGYRSFIQLLRANMRHGGGLRIDHAMSLQHLYWVPLGQKSSAGAYVQYPMQDLIGILALESHRHKCLIVGEDLGTVPEGFRERMAEANILSYRVLYFEQDPDTGAFQPPSAYPVLALAVVGSHDLPTLRGWWEGRDLVLKEKLGLFPGPGEASRQQEARNRDRIQLLEALRYEGLLAPDGEPDIPTLARAVHAFVARTPSILAMVQIDDLSDEADPVNIPATSDEHPNWRRRLSMTLEELAARPRFNDIAGIFRTERGGNNRSDVRENV